MKNSYNIKLTKKAEKFIKKQDKDTQKRLIKGIVELPESMTARFKIVDAKKKLIKCKKCGMEFLFNWTKIYLYRI